MSDERLFLVSGGSGGIGAAVCGQLAERGLRPVVGYHRRREAAEAIALRYDGIALGLDLSDTASIDHAVDWLAAHPEPLAGVVLAGSPPPVPIPFSQIDPADMARQWQVNVAGPQRLLAGLVRRCFRPRREGVVVGVLSQAIGGEGRRTAAGMGAYAVAKHGMAGLLDLLQADHPWLQVRSVKPGYTETAMLQAFDERFLALQRERQAFQTAEEVASLIVQEAMPA